jgi:hypothetical protein
MHTSHHTPAQYPVDSAEPPLDPDLVVAVLRELDRTYDGCVYSHDHVRTHIEARGYTLVAGQLARRLRCRPAAEVLAFFKRQAAELAPDTRLHHRTIPITVAQIQGLGEAFETGRVDVFDDDTRSAALDAVRDASNAQVPAVLMAQATAELACWLAYNQVARREESAESAIEDCARRFVVALEHEAPRFVNALRAYAAQPDTLIGVGTPRAVANDAAPKASKKRGGRHAS